MESFGRVAGWGSLVKRLTADTDRTLPEDAG